MSIVVSERYGSRTGSYSPTLNVTYKYTVHGSEDPDAIIQAVKDTAPASVNGVSRGTININQIGSTESDDVQVWEADVNYSHAGSGGFSPVTVETPILQFSTTGATETIQLSKSTRHKLKKDDDSTSVPDFDNLIKVTEDGDVEGVDIVVPSMNWTETHIKSASEVSSVYIFRAHHLTGKLNNSDFRNFQKGEVLFLGIDGTYRQETNDYQLNFQFSMIPNRTNFEVAGITVPNKYGWDYLWVKSVDKITNGKIGKTVKNIYIERVYDFGDFDVLDLPNLSYLDYN